ncbi:hypothetical protein HWC26_gp114 [Aeromonas phage 2L372X]|uniref:Uncharacterized protein n=2 Tax=Plateaulakevirus TaxID=2843436 RepID=A0A5B9N6W9_9CAUD|nr:hypothetical protein HWC25_gp115 [Aeromonas phage 2L372D]YP_009846451.1 hypothetical protein HWC26_gp114 [Aeromonas phage 2L372X]QDB74029.1 hypothetical protein 2L372D_115 [Aeromonas phage 2L372D]QEG08366.1 hypothetical protein [Aeromonas phage 2L372X]
MKDLMEILKGIGMWVRYLLTPVNIVVVLLLALLILSGCSYKPEPAIKVVTQEVKVPVYMPCLSKKGLPVRTDYVTINIKKNDNPVVKVRKLDKLTQQQSNYIGVLEKALNGCSE